MEVKVKKDEVMEYLKGALREFLANEHGIYVSNDRIILDVEFNTLFFEVLNEKKAKQRTRDILPQ